METKQKIVAVILSATLAVISFIVFAKIFSIFYKPDLSFIRDNLQRMLIAGVLNRCRPEPLEKVLFIAGFFCLPFFLIVYGLWIKRLLENKTGTFIGTLYGIVLGLTVAFILFATFIIFKATSVYFPSLSYGDFYIFNSILDKKYVLFLLLPFAVGIYLFLLADFSSKPGWEKFFTRLSDVFCLFISFYMGLIFLCSIDTRSLRSVHFESVFYSMVQLYKGVPLGAEGFSNSYGLYPYFLHPLFKLMGLSVFKCSVVFCLLITVSYLVIFFFLKTTVQNKRLIFLGFTSVVFLPTLSPLLFGFKLANPVDPYYQYLPIRYVFPSLFLLLSACYIKHKSASLYLLGSLLCPLSFLWNPDTGMVITLAWIALNAYSAFEEKDAKAVFRSFSRHVLKISAVFLIVIFLFQVFFFASYGKKLDWTLLFQTIIVFSQYGFGLLPMPVIHPWNILALAYIVGLGISVQALLERKITLWSKLNFSVAVLGAGMLLYYQGRSHDFTLFLPSFYFFILLTLWLDKILSLLKAHRNFFLTLLSFLISVTLSLSILLMVVNVKTAWLALQDSIKTITTDSPEKTRIEMNCEFIRKHAHPSEKIIILSGWSGVYFSQIPNVSAFHPDITELYLKSDYARLEKIVHQSDVKIFAEDCNALARVEDLLKNLKIADKNPFMVLLKNDRSQNTHGHQGVQSQGNVQ